MSLSLAEKAWEEHKTELCHTYPDWAKDFHIKSFKRGQRAMLEAASKWLDKMFYVDPDRTYSANEIQAMLDSTFAAEVDDG